MCCIVALSCMHYLKNPIWKNILSDDPESNNNPYKHKHSGRNKFAWSGYSLNPSMNK